MSADGADSTDPETVDVLVVGSGIAGCAAALGAARAGAAVLMITKASRPEDANTDWAQGGISTTGSDPETFREDILAASAGTADPEAVDVLVEDADEAVREVLIETLEIPFDVEPAADGVTDPGGSDDRSVEPTSPPQPGTDGADTSAGGPAYDLAHEAAHSEPRILHVAAETGTHILRPFLHHLEGHPDVTIRDDVAALELITHEGRVHGVLTDEAATGHPIYAGATVLATGGVGSLYARSTNPPDSTGDGIAMAALAGATVADMEFVQFHPTAFDGEEPFLLSEALRGEGAVLRNGDGERFMEDYHPEAELAPRDVVARAVDAEIRETGAVTLDVGPIDFASDFPGLHERVRAAGVEGERIPVAPCQHFLCGGIDVDDRGRTSLDRLYAAGECARTGVHGANRLASTSLLEGLVWGRRAGTDAVGHEPAVVEAPTLRNSDPALPERFAAEKFTRLRRVMEESVGLVRDPDELVRAAGVLRRLKGEVDAYVRTRTSRSLYELRNAAVTALLIANAAAENDRSVGCHHLAAEPEDARDAGASPAAEGGSG